MNAAVSCADELRRARARASGLGGIDSISVSADQLTLTVIFFGTAPENLEPGNFRIDGGRRVTGIRVVIVDSCADHDPDVEACAQLTVDRAGDFSAYRLCVVQADQHGHPGHEPLPGLDPRYACAEFTFKQNCPSVLDCAPVAACPPPSRQEPVIDYLAKDYASFRQLLLDRLALTMPAWTEQHVPDIGIALAEVLAYAGDELSYQQDVVATEAYLGTARLRTSVRRHVRLVDYPMHDGCSARVFVCVETSEQVTLTAGDFRFVTLDAGALGGHPAVLEADLRAAGLSADSYQVFEPVQREDIVLYPAHNEIRVWTWGDEQCCLPEGATAATLADSAPDSDNGTDNGTDNGARDGDAAAGTGDGGAAAAAAPPPRVLQLRKGDVLIFEELRGPGTGAYADADYTHRQAVRLTSVTPGMDDLYGQPVLEVTWAREDALTFPLCVSSRGGPDCRELTIGVAHGNVILADHGRSLSWCDGVPEAIDVPSPPPGQPACPPASGFGCPDQGARTQQPAYPPLPTRFEPVLAQAPVTQRVPFPDPAGVARAQAGYLLALPGRALDALRALRHKVGNGEDLTAGDLAYLTLLFGEKTLQRARIADYPADGLQFLTDRFSDLLEPKLHRLTQLIRRARAGYVLAPDDEGWEIAQTWGDQEGQALDPASEEFRGPAAVALRPDATAALPALEIDLDGDGADPWRPHRDLLDSGPTDRDVVGEVDDDGTLHLRFGDGRAGVAPPAGGRLLARYRVGLGSPGNVGHDVINRVVCCATRITGVSRVRNPLPAAGGSDPEPVSQVRQRAPQEFTRQLLRAITAADYGALGGQVPGVQRAAGDLRWTGSWYEAQAAVDPLGAETAPRRLLDEVLERLHPYRRIGHDVTVHTARLVPLDLAVDVQVDPGFIAGHVEAALLAVLGAGVLPDGRLAFFHPDNLTFGTPVRVSQIVAAAAAVPGVLDVTVTRLQRLFGPPAATLAAGLLRIGALEVAELANDRSGPEGGRLTLNVHGGR
jgi:predicted phage baseplate assembly protein